MIATHDAINYLQKVMTAMDKGKIENPRVHTCPDCDRSYPDDPYTAAREGHVIYWRGWGDDLRRFDDGPEDYTIVIACEGYWLIDPASVGLPRGHWS